MDIVPIYLIILLVTLITSTFVLIVNIKDYRKSLMSLDFRVVSTQLVILLAWIVILSQALQSSDPEQATLNAAAFILSVVIGITVIRSVIKEHRAGKITRSLIQSLTQYNKRLRELDQQKTDFIGLASHQLRTPNSIVSGYSSMLLEGDFGKLNDEAKDVVQKINKASKSLNEIINELLDGTRIEQHRVQYKKTRFDFIDLLEELEEEFSEILKEDGLKLTGDFDHKTSINIEGDRDKIEQALLNILDNAHKYTKEGGVKITARKINNKAKISISDTGIGIKNGELGNVFEKFVRATNAKDIDVTGSGLGLFIAKEIVEFHNGKIWVESAGIGKGSTFKIEFPIAK